jgi:hypothetical protein
LRAKYFYLQSTIFDSDNEISFPGLASAFELLGFCDFLVEFKISLFLNSSSFISSSSSSFNSSPSNN